MILLPVHIPHGRENGKTFETGKMLPTMARDGSWIGYYVNGTKNYDGSYKNGQKDENVFMMRKQDSFIILRSGRTDKRIDPMLY